MSTAEVRIPLPPNLSGDEVRTPTRLKQEAQASGLETRIEQVDESEGLEAARLAPWLTLVRAPCRVFLLVDARLMQSD